LASQLSIYKPKLAAAIILLSGCLVDLNRFDEALGHAREAVQLYTELAEASVEGSRHGLSVSFKITAMCLNGLGRAEEAAAAETEAAAYDTS
jgi:tetratricopeptide (TPR) repeat protein